MKTPSERTLAIIGWPLGIIILVGAFIWPTGAVIACLIGAAILVTEDNMRKRRARRGGTEGQGRAGR